MTTADTNLKKTWPLSLACIAMLGSSVALASPEGGDVVEGDATIEYNGDWTRVLTGEITIIDWLSFNLAQGETVEFVMPSEASRVLNRITSGVPTEIDGNIIANGRVFIVNPSGVIFGENAVVNVGALYAAAGNISNNNFMRGRFQFRDSRGIVENRGHLTGDLIALVGGRVANHGTISAPNGTVVMAAGERVLIGELLGNTFVRLQRPTDLNNTPGLTDSNGPSLAAGDVFSLAAWNTGTIDAKAVNLGVSAGHMAIEGSVAGGEVTVDAINDSFIELNGDIHSRTSGLIINGDIFLTGESTLSSDGAIIAIKGTIDSADGTEHDLYVDANGGQVRFYEDIGSVSRLGILDVNAGLARIYGDVSVNNQLNLYTPVAISGDSTIFDVGMGSALFGDWLYSRRNGRSSVSFLYDGEAWVGQGVARAPFQFRQGIGNTGTRRRAFRNITFGGDLGSPSRSSAFVFATGAMAGLDLISGSTDLGHSFLIDATESITMGLGQKMTSFGSLTLNASSNGVTTIAVGDLNVLGDLEIASLGRAGGNVVFNNRAGGEVDWFGNEEDRSQNALMDTGLELIASGDINIIGDIGGGDGGPVLLAGGGTVQLLNNSGSGSAPFPIEIFEGGVTTELFASMMPASADSFYSYDLTIIPPIIDDGGGTTTTQANLAEALDETPTLRLRTDDPLLAARQVLTELGLQPVDQTDESIRVSASTGSERFLDGGVGTTNDAQAFGVTIDRLNRSSVERLTRAYVTLLGQRTGDSTDRERAEQVRQALSAGRQGEANADLAALAKVLRAIELLELTPREIEHAKRQLITKLAPSEANPADLYELWFGTDSAPMAINND